MVAEVAYAIRFLALSIVIVNNTVISSYTLWKVKFSKKRPKSIAPILLYPAAIYTLFGLISCFYNLFYRFAITVHDCKWSDSIDEWLIVCGRITLFIFYTFRLESTFKESSYAVSPKLLMAIRVFGITEFLVFNLVWINILPMEMVVTKTRFGVYCHNTGNLPVIVTHFIIDTFTAAALLFMFVYRLYQVSAMVARNKFHSKQEDKLLATAKNNTILTGVSMASTWILLLSSLVSHFPIPFMRWIFPLDWAVNVWCLFLMFRLVRWDKTICFKRAHLHTSDWLQPEPTIGKSSTNIRGSTANSSRKGTHKSTDNRRSKRTLDTTTNVDTNVYTTTQTQTQKEAAAGSSDDVNAGDIEMENDIQLRLGVDEFETDLGILPPTQMDGTPAPPDATQNVSITPAPSPAPQPGSLPNTLQLASVLADQSATTLQIPH